MCRWKKLYYVPMFAAIFGFMCLCRSPTFRTAKLHSLSSSLSLALPSFLSFALFAFIFIFHRFLHIRFQCERSFSARRKSRYYERAITLCARAHTHLFNLQIRRFQCGQSHENRPKTGRYQRITVILGHSQSVRQCFGWPE